MRPKCFSLLAVSDYFAPSVSYFLVAIACFSTCVDAALPLRDQIDAIVEEARIGPEPVICTDSQFLRRAYLDLVGTVPTAEAARKFLRDSSPDRRARLVDRLLGSPDFARQMQITFDVMLMERRAEKHVKAAAWKKYLFASFDTGKPLNKLCREMLVADGTENSQPAAAKFFLDREAQPHLLTRDVGRMFLGMDFQCAQCHDHPLVDDYYQQDYYGIYAFISGSYLFTDAKAKKTILGEKVQEMTEFASVFDADNKQQTGPLLPGHDSFEEPTFKKGEEYSVAPDKENRGVPKFSRRGQLANAMTDGSTEAFNRNMANRLWAHMMGRGLVHPVDFHHSDNRPSHPQLLDALAGALVEQEFDVRVFLREIALSKTYQQSSELPQLDEGSIARAKAILQVRQQQYGLVGSRLAAAEETALHLDQENDLVAKSLADAKKRTTTLQQDVAATEKLLADSTIKTEQARSRSAQSKQALQIVDALAAQTEMAAKQLTGDMAIVSARDTLTHRATELRKESDAAELQFVATEEETQVFAKRAAAERLRLERTEQAITQTEQLASELDGEHERAQARQLSAQRQLSALESALADAKVLAAYAEALAATEADQATEQLIMAEKNLVARWNERCFIATLRPLSSEQIGRATLEVVGMTAKHRAAAATEDRKLLEKEKLPDDDGAKMRRIEQVVHDKSAGDIGTFVTVFAQGAGQSGDSQPTVSEALFLSNSSKLNGWLSPSGGNLVDRLLKTKQAVDAADELYLSVLSRRPDEIETQAVAEHLATRKDNRKGALQEMVSALLCSVEFRFNH